MAASSAGSPPQQSSWPTGPGPGSPFQATWPNAAPQTQPKPARKARARMGRCRSPRRCRSALGRQSLGAASGGAPTAARASSSRHVLSLGPPRLRRHLLGRSRNSRSRLRKPIFRPRGNKRSSSSRKPALSPCRLLQPALAGGEKPSRKRALLKWGVVLLLLAIMAVGGWLVLGHVKGSAGLHPQSPPISTPTIRGAARPTSSRAPRSAPLAQLSRRLPFPPPTRPDHDHDSGR